MTYPERFSNLPEYAFPRLRTLLDAHAPGGDVIHMTIGEPKHAFPDWITDIIVENAEGFANYPPNEGAPELRMAISDWIKRRYGASMDPETQIMALNGTREGLYNAVMALCPEKVRGQTPIVLTPNPFYQVYAVAALSIGAEPYFVAATPENGFLPNYDELPPEVLNRVAAAYICSPSNPQGSVATAEYWRRLITLAEKYDFVIFADECYSEIYRHAPPVGAIEVAQEMGADPERLVIFHSLSKRSNMPGLRSGFVATGPENMRRMRQLRSYAGSPLPLPLQRVAQKVWADEEHVIENRALYAEKFEIADEILADVPGYTSPEAGFFLWLPINDGEEATLKLWTQTGVRVLPGAYLARDVDGLNPGKGFIRVALVAPKEEMQRGLITLRDCLYR
ncbi:class I and II aminotransferase [Actibacterium atlanticum]|uniref:Class I and II aminotransferase n=1 Tax=Actibacterium atlanticum TaxID=1461693 RepID=A0A058ZMH6_9RHOB|nr:aminotransferase class I/II-fold pyridoxal phosphate-dependent enzyme [Actibacterium atlanticum]KCV82402.1 class I and II aminotransferase [Actibacterium atlanticum]